jgi:hypothetical protein
MPMGAGADEERWRGAERCPHSPMGIAPGDAEETCRAAFGLGRVGRDGDMTQKYDERITFAVTAQMQQYLKLLAERQKTSVGDVVRQAVREHLDHQEDVLGSRSRFGGQVKRQLEEMQAEFLEQQARSSTLLLAAIILLQMKPGVQGAQVLERISQLAAHAGDEIRAVLDGVA